LRRLARFHRPTRHNSLHHKAPMGNRVMTYDDWYKGNIPSANAGRRVVGVQARNLLGFPAVLSV